MQNPQGSESIAWHYAGHTIKTSVLRCDSANICQWGWETFSTATFSTRGAFMLAEESHDVPCLLLPSVWQHARATCPPRSSFGIFSSMFESWRVSIVVTTAVSSCMWNAGWALGSADQTPVIKLESLEWTKLTHFTKQMSTEQTSSVLQDSLSSFDYLRRCRFFSSRMFQPHYNTTSPGKKLLLAVQIREILGQVTDPHNTQGFSVQPQSTVQYTNYWEHIYSIYRYIQ